MFWRKHGWMVVAAYWDEIWLFIRTFGTWQKQGSNRGWRLIEGILYVIQLLHLSLVNDYSSLKNSSVSKYQTICYEPCKYTIVYDWSSHIGVLGVVWLLCVKWREIPSSAQHCVHKVIYIRGAAFIILYIFLLGITIRFNEVCVNY